MRKGIQSIISYSFVNISIFLILILLTGCGDEKEQIHFTVYADSLIYVEGTQEPLTGTRTAIIEGKHLEYEVVEGIKHGSFKILYPNGNIEILGQIENNRNTGIWKYFYEDGTLECEGSFENDKSDGKWSWYYPTGELKEEGIFEQGRRIGIWRMFDGNGNVLQQVNYDSLNSIKSL